MSAIDPERPVGVIGAGTMGAGIAHVAAAAGHPVHLYDTDPSAVTRALDTLDRRLQRSVSKGRITGDQAAAIHGRITPAPSPASMADAALVVEAIVEDLDIKRSVLGEMEGLVDEETVLATNTSSLPVTAIAAALEHPDRMVGIHFFNPAPVMPLVEIVRGEATSAVVMETAWATVAAWGKTPVRCASTPGFIVNRVARPFYGEALRLLAEGTADAATIDAVVTGAGGFRMGPLHLMDLVGLDVNLAVSKSVYTQTFHDPRFAPNVIQQGLVDAGRLGRKTGRGFFDYADGAGDDEPAVGVTGSFDDELPPVEARGDLGHATGLVDRLAGAGVEVLPVAAGEPMGHLRVGPAVLVPTDGRTATELVASRIFGTEEVAVVDLVGDWAGSQRVALASADQATGDPAVRFAGLIRETGMEVSVVDDTPALVLARIVAQLASVAADAAMIGVADPADIDTAMRLGTNYPQGPLEWADRVGPGVLVDVLDHMRRFYGEDRYRASALLRRHALAGTRLRRGEGR